MRSYIILVSKGALSDLDGIAQYVSSLHRPESGHKYVNKILGRLASLSFTADIFQTSRFAIAKEIHPMAKQCLSSIIVGLLYFTPQMTM